MTVSLPVHDWNRLSAAERAALLARPPAGGDESLQAQVRAILDEVRSGGDAALAGLTRRLDGAVPERLRVGEDDFREAAATLAPSAIAALEVAITNVRRFHEAQRPAEYGLETMPGVRCERLVHAIDSVGLYVPAGSAPLPSAAVMLAVPAAIAGCPRRVLCTPPRRDGRPDPAVLTAARLAGVTEVYAVGGAQAIAAMAYGTETIAKVDKLFGPGSGWVTAAKALVAAEPGGPAIDMPAGPSEVLVIADAAADPAFVAADLLSQAEHGPDSQVILVAASAELTAAVAVEVGAQLGGLSRRAIAERAITASRLIVAASIEEAVDISNRYAPEHLILQVAEPRRVLPLVRNAGSVFLGPWSPESAGDYCSGTNHVLPTAGAARSYSGLSVEQFMRHMSVQEISRAGLQALSSAIVELARLEGLDAHAEAVTRRLAAAPEGSP